MTDLDRQIAEIKGWRRLTRPELKKVYGAMGIIAVPESGDLLEVYQTEGAPLGNPPWKACPLPAWSTSDSKALELFRELAATPEVLAVRIERYGSAADGISWGCSVTCDGGEMKNRTFLPIEPTLSEAICRAYIAAVTWMRGKKT